MQPSLLACDVGAAIGRDGRNEVAVQTCVTLDFLGHRVSSVCRHTVYYSCDLLTICEVLWLLWRVALCRRPLLRRWRELVGIVPPPPPGDSHSMSLQQAGNPLCLLSSTVSNYFPVRWGRQARDLQDQCGVGPVSAALYWRACCRTRSS